MKASVWEDHFLFTVTDYGINVVVKFRDEAISVFIEVENARTISDLITVSCTDPYYEHLVGLSTLC